MPAPQRQVDIDLARVAPYLSTAPAAEEETSPLADIAVGSIPGLGLPQALRDWRRAEQTPSGIRKNLARASAVLAAVPIVGRPLAHTPQLAGKFKRYLNTYHVSHEPIPSPRHDPRKLLSGEGQATEGPGFYLTQHPGKSLVYVGQSVNKNYDEGRGGKAYLHRYALPREEYNRFVKPWNLKATHPETTLALQRAFPRKSLSQMQAEIDESMFDDSLLGLWESSPQSHEDMSVLLDKLRHAGVPGVRTREDPGAYLVTHFPERLRLLGSKPHELRVNQDTASKLIQSNWMFGHKPEDFTSEAKRFGVEAYRALRKGRPLPTKSSYNPKGKFANMTPGELAAFFKGGDEVLDVPFIDVESQAYKDLGFGNPTLDEPNPFVTEDELIQFGKFVK